MDTILNIRTTYIDITFLHSVSLYSKYNIHYTGYTLNLHYLTLLSLYSSGGYMVLILILSVTVFYEYYTLVRSTLNK